MTNRGVNGDTTTGVLARLDSAVPPGTNIVILKIGVNDLVNHHVSADVIVANNLVNHHVSADVIVANKRKIVERLRAKGAEVYLLETMQQGIIDRADLHVESSRAPNSTSWHLTLTGYAIVVRRTLPAIETLIRKVEKRRYLHALIDLRATVARRFDAFKERRTRIGVRSSRRRRQATLWNRSGTRSRTPKSSA